MDNTIQLYVDEKREIKGYPITSPDRVIYENGVNIKDKIEEINSSLDNIVQLLETAESTQKRFDTGTSGKITFKAHLNNGCISLKGLSNSYSSQSNIIDSIIGVINNKCGIVNKTGFYQNLTVSYEASGYDYIITVSGFANYSIVDVYLNIGSYFIE